jgi:segregation and condensation protein B
MSERGEMEAVIEALLFVSSEPVPRARLLELFEEEEREQAAEALAAVLARYAAGDGRGVMVEDVAGGVRLVTRPEMGVWLRRFFDVASGSKLSMAALETLAIIAYRQPITGPEIQELRSVSPVGVLKTLLEKRLVRISGRKEVVGKPFLYATTREFLVHFGLNSLRDLPPLEEFEETFGAAAGPAERGARAAGAERAAGEEGEAWADRGRLPDQDEDGDEDREERILREAADLDERGEAEETVEREGMAGWEEAAGGEEPAEREALVEREALAERGEPAEREDVAEREDPAGRDVPEVRGERAEPGKEPVEVPEDEVAGWDPAGEDELTAARWETAVEEDLAAGEAEAPGEAETAAAGSKVER